MNGGWSNEIRIYNFKKMERYNEKRAWEEAQKLQKKVKEGTTGYAYAERLVEEEKIPQWAKSYVDMPKERLEEGIKKILDEIVNSPARETPQGLFTEAMMDMEMYYDLQDLPNRQTEAEKYLSQAQENLEKVIRTKGDFEIRYKNQEKDIIFGNLSLANAFLGDIYYEKYLDDRKPENWFKDEELYAKAIEQEKEQGKADELRTIQAVRKIARGLGNEESVECRKTTRRKDLRGEAADMIIRYQVEENSEVRSSYIDATRKMSDEKVRKQKMGSQTYVVKISSPLLEQILTANFDAPFVTEEEYKKRPRTALHKIGKQMAAIVSLSRQLETALNLKEPEKLAFRKAFYMDENKLKKVMPFIDVKKLQEINWFEL